MIRLTKAWLIEPRHDPKWKWHHEYALAKRPREVLFDPGKDSDQVQNVAADPAHAETRRPLTEQLLTRMTDLGDLRVVGDGSQFDHPPFTGLPANSRPTPATRSQ